MPGATSVVPPTGSGLWPHQVANRHGRFRLPGLCVLILAMVPAIGCPGPSNGGGGDAGASLCGNGRLDPGEECDPEARTRCIDYGLDGDTAECTLDCTVDLVACVGCGNGRVEPGEECEPTVPVECADFHAPGTLAACGLDCRVDLSACTGCGDGVIDPGEECDRANLGGVDCSDLGFDWPDGLVCAACRFDTEACETCGDGEINGPSGVEECDDGNPDDGDGCGSDCRLEVCGDGRVTPLLGERCEEGVALDRTCQDFGYVGGNLGCDACQYDTSQCRDPVCGDGAEEGAEECDDGNLDNYDGCTAACRIERCQRGRDTDDDGLDDCDDVETCDGVDNNGNGAIDELPTDEEIGEPCFDGSAEVREVGACHDGELGCRNGELVCLGEVLPRSELCNGLDDDCDGSVPSWEADQGCGLEASVGSVPSTLRFELEVSPIQVDLVFNLDTSSSMADELAGIQRHLEDTIVPGVSAIWADSAFALTRFEDFPFGPFGRAGDLPFRLVSRVSTDVDALRSRSSSVDIGSGGDPPESGLESLYQIATGDGVSWSTADGDEPTEALAVGGRVGMVGRIGAGETDAFVLSEEGGSRLRAEVTARRIGTLLDARLDVYDGAGNRIGQNDDRFGLDPGVDLVLSGPPPYRLELASCCGEAALGAAGDYFLEVFVDERPYLLAVGLCEADDGATSRRLVPGEEAWPYDVAACMADCTDATDLEASWVSAFCGDGGPLSSCGDRVVDFGEECDDGNVVDGDGCSADCRVQRPGVVAFDFRDGFSLSQGHGRLGGVGFRESSLPVILHITDDISHDAGEYQRYDSDVTAHSAVETLDALEAMGARVIGVASGEAAVSLGQNDPRDLDAMALATAAWVPVCAFDGSDARESGDCAADACCTDIDGRGRPATADGLCPLVFRVRSDGTGLSEAILDAIEGLADFSGRTVGGRLSLPGDQPDAVWCLVGSLEAVEVAQEGDCLPEVEALDVDEDGRSETLANVTAGSRVTFELSVANADSNDVDGDGDRDEACLSAGDYALVFELVDESGAVLASYPLSLQVGE